MATAIKAIPTLYGADAERFREAADAAERRFDACGNVDWNNSPAVQQARRIWANMIR